MKAAGWSSNLFVRGRLQAALYNNRRKRIEAIQPEPPPEPDPEIEGLVRSNDSPEAEQ